MSKNFKSIAATTAAISTLALTGCGNVVEKNKPTYEQSYIDESHSIQDENTSLVIVNGFSDMDRSIASSIKRGHFFFTNMMRGNEKITFEYMLKYNLGMDFGISKGDRYVSVLDRTIEKYSEAISYYDNGEVDKFRQCYRELVLCDDYLNVSDLVEILCSKVNSYSPSTIVDTNNYQFDCDGIIIDGTIIKGLVSDCRNNIKANNVIDLFKMCFSYKKGECSFDQYASEVLYSVPNFISAEMNKVFNTLRICVDNSDGQIYAYNIQDIRFMVGSQEKYLKSNYDVSRWEYNDQFGLYFAYNSNGFGNILEDGCECEKYIEGIDYVRSNLLKNSRCDYCTFDNFEFQGFYNNYLACSKEPQLKK